MATHSSILAWKILWTEDPGELQSMGHKESVMTEHARRYTYTYLVTYTYLDTYLVTYTYLDTQT